jgi:hypothetical protein
MSSAMLLIFVLRNVVAERTHQPTCAIFSYLSSLLSDFVLPRNNKFLSVFTSLLLCTHKGSTRTIATPTTLKFQINKDVCKSF